MLNSVHVSSTPMIIKGYVQTVHNLFRMGNLAEELTEPKSINFQANNVTRTIINDIT